MRATILALLLLAWVSADATAAEKRFALVIGNAAYSTAKLKNPVNDARAMAAALRQLGFDVSAHENLTQAQMQRAIIAFGERLGPDAVALFYYSGHGLQVGGRNFLVPVDADVGSEQSVPLTTLDMDDVVAQMAAAHARINLVILDACRNNPFAGRVRGLGGGLAAIDAPTGTLIAYATAPGKVASDGIGRLGLYTEALLKAMAQPGLPVEQVFKRVRASVVAASHDLQTPWETSSLIGDFYFSRSSDKSGDILPPAIAVAPKAENVVASTVAVPKVAAPSRTFKDCPTCPEMAVLPAPPADDGLRATIAVGVYDVTFAEWDACVADGGCQAYAPDDERWGRGNQPVINVSWDDAQAYVQWLNGRIAQAQAVASRSIPGGPYRLLTAGEWEYAARASSQMSYAWGDDIGSGRANCRTCGSAWDGRQSAPVGAFVPNRFGLFDMAGNVKQWVADCHDAAAPDADEPQSCSARVLRGGSWRSSPPFIRADSSDWAAPTYRFYDIGFRVARDLPQ